MNTYMWNLEKWYRSTGLQGGNRDTDVENKCMDTKGGKWRGGGVMNWEIGIDIYTLICIKWITNKNLLFKKINKIKFKNSKESFTFMPVKFNFISFCQLLQHINRFLNFDFPNVLCDSWF